MGGGGIGLDAGGLGEVSGRAIEMPGLGVKQCHIVMQRRVVGMETRSSRRQRCLHARFARARTQQSCLVCRVAGHDLEPEFGHLVGGVLPIGHATWRAMRVVTVGQNN